jgi:hypothetical protein
MYSEDEVELTAEERSMLAALPREMAPGDLLEARVVKALKSEGQFGAVSQRSGRGLWTALRIAAAVALFAGGVATGRYLIMPDTPRSAAVPEPANRTNDSVQPQRATPAQGETVVAEREIWM